MGSSLIKVESKRHHFKAGETENQHSRTQFTLHKLYFPFPKENASVIKLIQNNSKSEFFTDHKAFGIKLGISTHSLKGRVYK